MFAFATTMIILRFISRRNTHQVAIDDWVSLLSYVFLLAVAVCHFLISGPYGYAGTPVTELSPEQVEHFLIMLYADNICYSCCTATIKLSVTLLYRRIFVTPIFKHITSVLIAVLVCWGTAIAFTQAFSCTPVEASWILAKTEHCIDSTKFYDAVGISNIIFDFTLLLLPLPMIWRLHMDTRRKIQVSCVFFVGSFVCICSVLRVVFLQKLSTTDVSGSIWIVGIWTIVESAVGVSCACMPPLAHLLKAWHEKTTKVYSKHSNPSQPPDYYPSYNSNSQSTHSGKPVETQGYIELS
ncbi:hypothetical protein M426DRAFT_93422 [Hypoxylon sp. CI-4A]|nr:hypothetical protein M426DRAFT_93422 [Hypoxylon sp. CI-4A]